MISVLEDIKTEEERSKKLKTSSLSSEFIKVYEKLKRRITTRPAFIFISNLSEFLKSLYDLIITHMKDHE